MAHFGDGDRRDTQLLCQGQQLDAILIFTGVGDNDQQIVFIQGIDDAKLNAVVQVAAHVFLYLD
ncbi:hypothetical protein D3C75_1052210 [compost metagenome]